jgi:hypothetical protein
MDDNFSIEQYPACAYPYQCLRLRLVTMETLEVSLHSFDCSRGGNQVVRTPRFQSGQRLHEVSASSTRLACHHVRGFLSSRPAKVPYHELCFLVTALTF